MCLERNGVRKNHWFDGDGSILKITISEGEVNSSFKVVPTTTYKDEEKAGKFIYAGVGNKPFGFFKNLTTLGIPTQRVNTNIISLNNGTLLALGEGGRPFRLNSENLEPIKEDDTLGGVLTDSMAYIAHPKVDPKDGNIYSIGKDSMNPKILHLYKSEPNEGKIILHNKIKFDSEALLNHDCCLAGDYLIVTLMPIKLNVLPMILKLKTFAECLTFDKNLPNKIAIIDKKTLNLVKTIEYSPSRFFYHYSNSFVENNVLNIDMVDYDSTIFNFSKFPIEYLNGFKDSKFNGELVRIKCDITEGKFISRDTIFKNCEFPVIDENDSGKKYEEIICLSSLDDKLYYNNYTKINLKTGKTLVKENNKTLYPNELNIINEKYLATVCYDAIKDKSELHILSRENLETISISELPYVFPMGFHGIWKDNASEMNKKI